MFTEIGPEARTFQKKHRSERLWTMTLVAPAELAALRPVRLSLDGQEVVAKSWSEAFPCVVSHLLAANMAIFDALQASGRLEWFGCSFASESVSAMMEAERINPQFVDWAEVVTRVQWLFLMCGIRQNEVIVQVDPYTDEELLVRKAEIDRKRLEEWSLMESRRAAQKTWADQRSLPSIA